VLGEYQAKNDNLSEYLTLVKEKITKFDSAEVQHVPRGHNKRADILSKLVSTKRKGGNKSVIQEILSRPSIEKPSRVLDINVTGDCNYWMMPIYNYLTHGTLPFEQKDAAIIRRRACSYVILDGKLYRRGSSGAEPALMSSSARFMRVSTRNTSGKDHLLEKPSEQ
ncbi:hypothetical protein A2U01_0047906, partial [Trifolium medium]|nr:hypothetical protein [Trifolium medium]